MEEEDQSHRTHKPLDPAARRKHEELLQRLSLRSSSRRSDANSSPTFESTAVFSTRFSELKNSIDSIFSRCHPVNGSDSNSHLKSDLDKVSVSIAELENLVAEKSYFLPSYELRSSLKIISDLKQKLESLNSDLIPRKKFSFRNKNSKKDQIVPPKAETREPEKPSFKIPVSPGFRNEKNSLLVRNFRTSDAEFGEFTVSDLDNCEVRLIGGVRALFIHRIRSCRIYTGPVLGSILIEEAEGCVFASASQQVRVHLVKKSDFYLRVRSRPIVEDCCEVRFAPYNLTYDGIEQDLEGSGLAEETERWKDVDDFNWLRALPSPNWSIIPENERVLGVSITDSHSANNEL